MSKRKAVNMNSEEGRKALLNRIHKILDDENPGSTPFSNSDKAMDTMISLVEFNNNICDDFVGIIDKEIGEGLDKNGADAEFRDHALAVIKYNVGCRLIGQSFSMDAGVGLDSLNELLRFILQIQEALIDNEEPCQPKKE